MIVNKMISGRAAGGRMVAGLFAVVLAFASFDVLATAKEGEPVIRSRTLRYAADSLANPVAAQKLYRRIRMAAHMVCHQESDDTSNGRALAACVQQATGVAVASVNSEELTALHRARVSREERFAVSAWLTSPTPCAQCG
jgi:UrcA family protein